MKRAQLPSGETIDFPDTMADDEMDNHVRRRMGIKEKANPLPESDDLMKAMGAAFSAYLNTRAQQQEQQQAKDDKIEAANNELMNALLGQTKQVSKQLDPLKQIDVPGLIKAVNELSANIKEVGRMIYDAMTADRSIIEGKDGKPEKLRVNVSLQKKGK